MYCHKCGCKLIDGSTYCSKCGTKVQIDTNADNLEYSKHDEHAKSKYSKRITSAIQKGSRIIVYLSLMFLFFVVATFLSKVLFAQPIMSYLIEDFGYGMYAAIAMYFALNYVKFIRISQKKRVLISLLLFLGGIIAGGEGLGFTFTLILLYLLYLYKNNKS